MELVLGVDIGGSTTKVVGFNGETKIGCLQIKTEDQLTSFHGAVGKFLAIHGMCVENLKCIVVTGVGSSFLEGDVYGVKTLKVSEFDSIGYGGLYLSSKDSALVVSMGTGTAYVLADGKDMTHLIGSAVGGGTLVGLSRLLLGVTDLDLLNEYMSNGSLLNVDLYIGDICRDVIPSLPPDKNASNFGWIKSGATKNDLALGIANMVYQTIGILAVAHVKRTNVENIILTGSMTKFSCIKDIFARLENLHNVKFTIPDDAIFSTAVGAIMYYRKNLMK